MYLNHLASWEYTYPDIRRDFCSLYKPTCCVLLLDISLYFEISRLIQKYAASSERCLQHLCQGKLLIWLNLWNSALFLYRAASYWIWVGEQLHSENVSFSVCQSEQLYLLYSILPWKVGMSAPSYVQNEVDRRNKIVCNETKWYHIIAHISKCKFYASKAGQIVGLFSYQKPRNRHSFNFPAQPLAHC